jgi:hypothetical protein
LCATEQRRLHDICNVTFGKDHRTYDLALAILHEEIEHEAWFAAGAPIPFLAGQKSVAAGTRAGPLLEKGDRH